MKVLAMTMEGAGSNERARCRHCDKAVILVKFENYPDTWFHTTTGFLVCGDGESEAAPS